MNLSNIAAQLYTLRDYCKNEADLEQTLHKVKDIGYQAVQVSGVGPITPETIKRIADEAGLRICATHVSYDSLVQDFEANVQKHKLWNCPYVGIGGLPEQYRTNAEGYAAFAKQASEIGRRLKEHDLQFIYHNHQFEFEKFAGRTGMEILREESDPEAFGFELDTYWVHVGGVNPVDMIYRVNGRMGVVHLKDLEIVGHQQVFAEIGEGNLNFKDIIAACRETGVEWYVVEQDVCRRDPFESLAISLQNLRQFIL
ncbi:sugar phosphate isomerase/epimerase [Paenibacillus alkaliterrae]|uniref:sugar phosphate isomerase/epimerase family protein n=1 Tax=Paenibacillus alkaliterrae TaxID=320909 RepID=UPI001F426A0E|nr:sugar phosphate isomerase/epimerase [Paenibacillus alkaliterrae]MCF2939366.1 sugar phosphate isomerase/epimerase [Paenibacillus alkaliterrae]